MKKLASLLFLLNINSALALSVANNLDRVAHIYTWRSGHFCLLSNQQDIFYIKPHSKEYNIQIAATETDRECFTKARRLYASRSPNSAFFCLRSEEETDITNKHYTISPYPPRPTSAFCEEKQKLNPVIAAETDVKPVLIRNMLNDPIYVSIEGADDFCLLSNNNSTVELKPHSDTFVRPAATETDSRCFTKARKLWAVKIKGSEYETIGNCINSEIETDLQLKGFIVVANSPKSAVCVPGS